MEVKSVTYKKKLNTYYLEGWLSNQKMDEHIAEMLKQGWTILSGPTPGAPGPRKGIGLPGDTMVIVYQKP